MMNYKTEIIGMLENIDRHDVLEYLYKIAKDIYDECYPSEKGGAC